MKKYLVTVSAFALMAAGAAYAADPAENAAAPSAAGSAQKLSQAECDSLWMQANPSGAATIGETQAKPYVTDFKAANPDGDGTLDKAEFSKACSSGLVSGSASSGASSGESGSSSGAAEPGASSGSESGGSSGAEPAAPSGGTSQ